MSDTAPRAEQKTAYHLLWSHYIRTGIILRGEAAARFLAEHKFNPYHDPDDGRFTFKPGGGSLAPRSRSGNAISNANHGARRASAPRADKVPDRIIAASRTVTPTPSIGSKLESLLNRVEERPVPLEVVPPPPTTPSARTHPGEKVPTWRRRDPAKETAPVANWRSGGDLKRLEVEQRTENAFYQFFYNWGSGMSVEEAAAWAANSEVESRGDFRLKQEHGGPGRGLFQWGADDEDIDRRIDFEKVMGISIEESTLAQQHRFRKWELTHKESNAKKGIDAAVGAGPKAYAISLLYLRPHAKERTAIDRANIAEAIMRRIAPGR